MDDGEGSMLDDTGSYTKLSSETLLERFGQNWIGLAMPCLRHEICSVREMRQRKFTPWSHAWYFLSRVKGP